MQSCRRRQTGRGQRVRVVSCFFTGLCLYLCLALSVALALALASLCLCIVCLLLFAGLGLGRCDHAHVPMSPRPIYGKPQHGDARKSRGRILDTVRGTGYGTVKYT
jgi:hypothetical protein